MSATAKRILIVDDDQDIVLVLTSILEDAGYTVLTADGVDYLTQLQEREPPDLILLDMLLSGQDGRDIARGLKARQSTRHIPIVMISAHPTAAKEARAAGADSFIAKPFELDELLVTVAATVR